MTSSTKLDPPEAAPAVASDAAAQAAKSSAALQEPVKKSRSVFWLRLLLLLGFALLAGVLLARWLWSAPQAAAPVFVNLQHQRPGQARFSSWQKQGALGGAAEQVLADAMGQAGQPVVQKLIKKNHRRLLSDGVLEPSAMAIVAATRADLAILGALRCVQVGGAAEQGDKQVRAELQLRVIRLAEQRLLFRLAGEGLANDAQLDRACQKAEANAAQAVVAPLLEQLGAYLPLSAEAAPDQARQQKKEAK